MNLSERHITRRLGNMPYRSTSAWRQQVVYSLPTAPRRRFSISRYRPATKPPAPEPRRGFRPASLRPSRTSARHPPCHPACHRRTTPHFRRPCKPNIAKVTTIRQRQAPARNHAPNAARTHNLRQGRPASNRSVPNNIWAAAVDPRDQVLAWPSPTRACAKSRRRADLRQAGNSACGASFPSAR